MDWTTTTKEQVARFMDFSILPKETQEAEIREGCRIAREYNFAAFYTSSAYWAPLVKEELGPDEATIEIGTGIAFPFGSAPAAVKAFEVEDAVKRGCTAVDIVLNVGALKDRRAGVIAEELQACAQAAGEAVTKAILEVCYLTDDEIRAACALVVEAGFAFAKTSTGQFQGPTLEQVLMMKEAIAGSEVKLKVSGVQFPRPQNALAFMVAGAERIGTRAAPQIVDAWDALIGARLVPGR